MAHRSSSRSSHASGGPQVLRVLVLDEPTGMCLTDVQYSWPVQSSASQLVGLVQSFFQFGRTVDGGALRRVILELPASRQRAQHSTMGAVDTRPLGSRKAVCMHVEQEGGVQLAVFYEAVHSGAPASQGRAAAADGAATPSRLSSPSGRGEEEGEDGGSTPGEPARGGAPTEAALFDAARALGAEVARLVAARQTPEARARWKGLLDRGLEDEDLARVQGEFADVAPCVRTAFKAHASSPAAAARDGSGAGHKEEARPATGSS